MKKIIEPAVSGSSVKARVEDLRRQHPSAYAEPVGDGTYQIVTIMGTQEAGARAGTISESPPAP